RVDRAAHARVSRIDEADAGDEEEAGVDLLVAKDANETVPAHAEALRHHRLPDRGFLFFDARIVDLHVATPGDPLRAVEGGPRHDFSVHVLTRIASVFPDAGVGLLPALADDLGQAADETLHVAVERLAAAGCFLNRAEDLAVVVRLKLAMGIVADAHRTRAAVAGQMIEHLLRHTRLAENVVEHLQVRMRKTGGVEHPVDTSGAVLG